MANKHILRITRITRIFHKDAVRGNQPVCVNRSNGSNFSNCSNHSNRHHGDVVLTILLPFFSFFFFFLFFIPSVAGAATLFDSWVSNGDSITVDDYNFIIAVDDIKHEIVATSPNAILVIDEESCELLGTLKICYNDTDSTHNGAQKVRVIIERVENDLEVTRQFSSDTFLLGDEYEVNLAIENKGTTTVDNILLTEVLPEGLELKSVSGCDSFNQTVSWSGKLRAGQSDDCSYKFIPRKSGEHILLTKVTYFDGHATAELYSDSKKILPEDVLSVVLEKNDTTPVLGKTVRYWLNITNIADRSLDVDNLYLFIPASVKVVKSSSDLDINESPIGTEIGWSSESLKSGESKRRYIDLKPVRFGSFDLLTHGKYTFRSYTYNIPIETETIVIKSFDPLIELSLTNGQEILPGDPVQFSVWVQNPSDFENLTDVRAKVKTDLIKVDDGYINTITENGRRRLINIDFLPPELNSSQSFPILVNVTAKTSHGDSVDDYLELTVFVKPVQLIELTQTTSSSKITEGDSLTITVSVSNPNNRNFTNVKVYDDISNSLSNSLSNGLIRKGTGSKIFDDLGKHKSETAYQYELVTPDVSSETNFTIYSTLEYTDNSIVRTLRTNNTITVTPRALNLGAVLSVTESAVYLGQNIPLSIDLKNSDTETIKSVSVDFSNSNGFAIAPDVTFDVTELDPGESTVERNHHFIIPAVTGTAVFGPLNVTYEDSDGNSFSVNTNSLSFSVQSNILSSPLVNLSKTINLVGKEIVATTTVQNIGGSNLEGFYYSGYGGLEGLEGLEDESLASESLVLAPDEIKTFTRTHTVNPTYFDQGGSIHIPSSKVSFHDVVFDAYAFSNDNYYVFEKPSGDETENGKGKDGASGSNVIDAGTSDSKTSGASQASKTGESSGGSENVIPPSSIPINPVNSSNESGDSSSRSGDNGEETILIESESPRSKLVAIWELIKKILFWQRSSSSGEPD